MYKKHIEILKMLFQKMQRLWRLWRYEWMVRKLCTLAIWYSKKSECKLVWIAYKLAYELKIARIYIVLFDTMMKLKSFTTVLLVKNLKMDWKVLYQVEKRQ